MATPSVTNIFVSGTTADSGQVNTNFQDLLNALTDGNNDLSIAALTCSGTTTLNGSVNLGNAGADDLSISASLASNIPIKTNDTYDFGSATLGLQNIFLGGTGGTTAIKGAASITTYTMTLPGTVGVAGQQLLNSGSGALEWIAGQMATVAKSAAYVITDIDKVRTVLHTTGASSFDVTLPTASDNTNRIITVKKVDSGAGVVTVKAAETIDGVAGATGTPLTAQYEEKTFQSDGTVYHVLSGALASTTGTGLVSTGAQGYSGAKYFADSVSVGNVATPAPLFVSAPSTSVPQFSISSGATLAASILYDSATGFMAFSTNGVNPVTTKHMTLSPSGNVEILGRIEANDGISIFTQTSATLGSQCAAFSRSGIGRNTNNATWATFSGNDGSAGSIGTDGAGKLSLFDSASDKRVKKNIRDAVYGLKEILALRPVSFSWIEDESNKDVKGFIAQDLQEVLPELVRLVDESKGPDSTLTVSTTGMIPVLVSAIQEQQEVIESLKLRIEKLEG